jgi:hypothetical protein
MLSPVWHHFSGRTQPHMMLHVLAYAFWKTWDHLSKQAQDWRRRFTSQITIELKMFFDAVSQTRMQSIRQSEGSL